MVDEAQRKCSRGLEGLGGELSFSKGKTNRTERIFDLVAYRVCVCVHVPVHVYLCVCVHRVNVEAKSQPQESFLKNNPPHKGMCISMCVSVTHFSMCVGTRMPQGKQAYRGQRTTEGIQSSPTMGFQDSNSGSRAGKLTLTT